MKKMLKCIGFVGFLLVSLVTSMESYDDPNVNRINVKN